MADDRRERLKQETVEQLLRGLPVDGCRNGPDPRLVAVLEALRPVVPGPDDGELPGEAAAVAAFRAASRTTAGPARRPWALLAKAAARRPFPATAGRPLRAGLAVAVAGFALGGVAMAAGAGVLPTPFEGGPTAPAVSVSPVDGPSPGDAGGTDGTSDRPAGTRGRQTRGAGGGPHASPGATPTPEDGRVGGPVRGGGATAGAQGLPGENGQLSEVDQEALVDTLCSAYTHDELDAGERRRLERAAGGETGVRTFCAEHGVTSEGGKTGGHHGKDGSSTGGTDSGDRHAVSDGASGGDGVVSGGVSGGDAGSGGDDSPLGGAAGGLDATPQSTGSTPSGGDATDDGARGGGSGGGDDGGDAGAGPSATASPTPSASSEA